VRPPARRPETAALALLAGAAIITLGAMAEYRRRAPSHPHPPDSAPGRTARQTRFNGYVVTGRTVTIKAPRSEIYALWRDATALPRFLENVRAVEDRGDGTFAWTVSAPGGSATLIARLVEERQDEVLAWRSTPESEIDSEGKVMLRDAPGDRGTEVEALIAYRPPYGVAGHWIARAFRRDPKVQGRQDLKRLKMLIETGEIATAALHPETGSEAGPATEKDH